MMFSRKCVTTVDDLEHGNSTARWALFCDCEIAMSVDAIISAESAGSAWNALIRSNHNFTIQPNNITYYLFESNDEFRVSANNTDTITFTLPANVEVNNTAEVFEKFCMSKFNEVKTIWTNEEFATHYNELANILVDKNCTDDPFKLWNLSMKQINSYDNNHPFIKFYSNTHRCDNAVSVVTTCDFDTHKCDEPELGSCIDDTSNWYMFCLDLKEVHIIV